MTAAHVLSPESTVHILMWFCDQLLWINGYSCVHMLSYYEEVQTHPLNLFQYALLKYFLRCQFIKNISDPAQVLTQGVGAGGGMFGDYWHNKQTNSWILNDIGRNSLLGKRKKIAKFLMRTLTYRSTFLYELNHTTAESLVFYKSFNTRFCTHLSAFLIPSVT